MPRSSIAPRIPSSSLRCAAPDGFEVVDNPERLFDPSATMIMRAIEPPPPPQGLDIWTSKLLKKPIQNVIWTSGRGVHATFHRAAKRGHDFILARHLASGELYARGVETAAALRGLGLRPRLVSVDSRGLIKRLPTTELRKQRVALQLDAAHAKAERRDGHPITLFLRSTQARIYTVRVGIPDAE